MKGLKLVFHPISPDMKNTIGRLAEYDNFLKHPRWSSQVLANKNRVLYSLLVFRTGLRMASLMYIECTFGHQKSPTVSGDAAGDVEGTQCTSRERLGSPGIYFEVCYSVKGSVAVLPQAVTHLCTPHKPPQYRLNKDFKLKMPTVIDA